MIEKSTNLDGYDSASIPREGESIEEILFALDGSGDLVNARDILAHFLNFVEIQEERKAAERRAHEERR